MPINSDHLPQFIMVLLPEFKYHISARNVSELLEAFGRDSGKTKKSISWSGIRKGLEEYKKRLDEEETDLFIGSAFNSSSIPYRKWVTFVTFVAAYHFIMVTFSPLPHVFCPPANDLICLPRMTTAKFPLLNILMSLLRRRRLTWAVSECRCQFGSASALGGASAMLKPWPSTSLRMHSLSCTQSSFSTR